MLIGRLDFDDGFGAMFENVFNLATDRCRLLRLLRKKRSRNGENRETDRQGKSWGRTKT